MISYCVVLVTAKDKKQARIIARVLLENRLIACANIVAGVESLFWWQGKIDTSQEVLLVLKSKKSLVKKIIVKVKAVHSYQTPEIIALPILDGSKDYLAWIDGSISNV